MKVTCDGCGRDITIKGDALKKYNYCQRCTGRSYHLNDAKGRPSIVIPDLPHEDHYGENSDADTDCDWYAVEAPPEKGKK